MIGKGGRANEHIFIDEKEKQAVLQLKDGNDAHDNIIDRSLLKNDCDLHRQRQLRAIDVYDRTVNDMKEHPERREYYQKCIHDIYSKHGRTCKENLDNPYCVRGMNRDRLSLKGRK